MAGLDFAAERGAMVERQLRARGITDPRILEAFRAVPREMFVSADHAALAYGDHPLPIEAGQTISQPYVVAWMIEAAGVGPGDTVLEVGAGSGYAAAVLGRIARRVMAIERHPELAALASERIARLGSTNVTIHAGDGSTGWPDAAPYQAILAAASAREIPAPLVDQLAPGGRLVLPVGDHESVQQLLRVTRVEGAPQIESLGAVRFVPLVAGSPGNS